MASSASVSPSGAQGTPAPSSTESPQLKVSFSQSSGSFPIRAPISYDSDNETSVENNGNKRKSNSSNSSISSYSGSESEGFLSGEDEFETASEKPFVEDEVEEEISRFVQPVVGSSFPKTRIPIAQPSLDDDDDDDDDIVDEEPVKEVEDDGPSEVVRVKELEETPKVGILGDEEGIEDSPLRGKESPIVSGLVESGMGRDADIELLGIASEDSKIVAENGSGVNSESGVLGSEEKEPSSETISAELIEDKVPIIVESPAEHPVSTKEEFLPEIAELDVNVKPVVEATPAPERQVLEVNEINNGAVEEKKGEENFVPESAKLDVTVKPAVEETLVPERPVLEVSEINNEAVEEKKGEEDFVPENAKLDVTVKPAFEETPASEVQVLEVNEINTEAVEEKKSEEDFVPENAELDVIVKPAVEETPVPERQALEVNEINNEAVEKKSEEDFVPENVKLDVIVKPAIEETPVPEKHVLEVTELCNGAMEEKKSEVFSLEENGIELKTEELKIDTAEGLEGVSPDQETTAVEKSASLEETIAAYTDMNKVEEQSTINKSSEKSFESADDSIVETPELEPHESKTEATELEQSNISDMGSISVEKSFSLDQEAESEVLTAGEETQHSEDIEASVNVPGDKVEDGVVEKSHTPIEMEAGEEVNAYPDEEEVDEGSLSEEDGEELVFGGSQTAEQIMKELERGSGSSFHSGAESSQDHSQRIDGQIVTDSDEADTDEEGDGKELFDSAALAALLKAATGSGSDGSSITISSPDGSKLFSVERPVGLGPSLRALKPASRPNRSNLFTPSELTIGGESDTNLSEEEKKKLEKIQLLRVKFLRLVQRLGHSPEDSIASQVLYRLVLAAGRSNSPIFSLETAKRTAMQLEEEKKDDLDFSLNILVLGKTGVGKSATINSIFGEEKALIDAFEPGTVAVKEIVGTVDGVNIRVFDTPGLRAPALEQAFNQKVLSSVKKFTKKCPPDIVLYVDRLDTQTRDLNDLPLLRSISSTLGSSIWRSAIVTLTHAASAPPDGPSGSPLSYDVFVAQRSHIVQQSIGQAVGDLRLMNPSLMNPVSLVENHPSCRKNREGQRILPNGQIWKPQLLLLCYSMKILSEASSLSKPQDSLDPRKLFGFRVRSPPLPYLLSSLLQSRAHPKLSADQGGENGDSDIDLGDFSDSDQEDEEDEYDQLPPFKPLRKSQISKLSKEQKKAYFDEYEYRVKLLQKKQLRDEVKRLKEMKKKGKDGIDDYGYIGEDADQENGAPAAVPVPLPDMSLPPSFDGDNPAYRYRFLEPTSQLLTRPVLDTHGWDHDCGYDGVSLEQSLAIASQFPAGIAVQITKDKKEFNLHLDSSVAAKHGENGSTMAGFDIQNIGKQLAYIVKGETKFKNFKKNKTAAGVSITFLGENVATGVKIEDQIAIGKRVVLVGSTGTVRSQGDVAYGANLEARLKEKDFPIGQDQSTLGLSLMKWRGDLALGANLQSQFSIGRSSKMAVRVGLNNKLSGQITVKTSSSEQLQIALVGILPIAISIFRSIWPASGENYSTY